jgi:uncharacterized membrane protein YhiD involved in acid resistance
MIMAAQFDPSGGACARHAGGTPISIITLSRARLLASPVCAGLLVITITMASAALSSAQTPFPPAQQPAPAAQPPAARDVDQPGVMDNLREELFAAVVRLPIAAFLGAALALRPRRRGTPIRQPAVVQTQIILAVVGALIMLVVGASLARAFGIVGAANLIRYRSKIDDPKDAVVMLCTLSVGLAAGVGLYGLALFGTFFLTVALWIIEGFEPPPRVFELSIKLGEKTAQLRPRIESILRRFKAEYELRGQSEEEVSYMVTAPLGLHTDRVSNALTALVATGKGAVEWKEQPATKGKKA